MSTTLLRLGLWTVILVLAVYVLAAAYSDQSWAQVLPQEMLLQILVVAIVVTISGIVLRILGVGVTAVRKPRCQVCRTPVSKGAIYCREHLRSILSDEDEKTHMTRVRRR